jgi:hypothetical protein
MRLPNNLNCSGHSTPMPKGKNLFGKMQMIFQMKNQSRKTMFSDQTEQKNRWKKSSSHGQKKNGAAIKAAPLFAVFS